MPKLPLFLAFILAFILAGCTVVTTTRPLYREPPTAWQPAYVYTYDRGCWADDVWYAPCPWYPGPSYGYYVYVDGYYRWHGDVVWVYRPGYPPPRAWVTRPPRYRHPPSHPRGHRPYVPADPRPPPGHRRF